MEDSSSECAAADVHIRVLLPDGNSLLLNIKRHCTTKQASLFGMSVVFKGEVHSPGDSD